MITDEILEALRKNVQAAKKANPEQARAMLQRIGVLNKRGNLTKHYRSETSKPSRQEAG